MFYTYVLYSNQHNRFYIGLSANLVERIKHHDKGMVRSSKPYRPWTLVWFMEHQTRSEAFSRERKLKNLKSHKRLVTYMHTNGSLMLDSSSEFSEKIRESTKNP